MNNIFIIFLKSAYMKKLNAYHYVGIALMGAGLGNYIMNARSLGIFLEEDLAVGFTIIAGQLIQLAVFLGLGFFAYRRGTRLAESN